MTRLFGLLAVALAGPPAAAADADFFEAKIRPVLVKECYGCHSAAAEKAGKLKGGLRLDTRDAVRGGGDSGPAVVPGKPAESLLVRTLRYDGDVHMPPKGKLPDAVVKDFETWVRDGATDPRAGDAAPKPTGIDFAKGKEFWSFRPPEPHAPPAVRDAGWPKRPIDRFVLAKLEAAGQRPNPPADPRAFLRRLTFDLTGLPPTPEEAEAFARDPSVETAVERMLASPAYGERWARLWLDVARFAEDQAHIVGDDKSLTYPNAYLYRDWVIGALNADMPYDRFVKLQLAADLFEGEDSKNLAALGFLGLGPKYYRRNALEVMADEWEDRVDVVGRGLLGLTVACARCHDHKFDPIGTKDYYALAGVFAGTQMYNKPLSDKPAPKPDPKADPKAAKGDKAPRDAMHVVREGKPTDLNVFVRGDVENKGPVTPRRFMAVLSAGDPKPFAGGGSGRKELAEAVADPGNPLTARVIVNRVWAAYFGRGLVGTASNFGTLGDRPTHPELLDDLAVRFVRNGWSLKWLHREIALSATYRQSAAARADDPENRLLGRVPRRRLTVEGWRDAVLAAAGTLDRSAVGGKSIDPADPKATRRTVYAAVSRLELNRLLALFDFPDPNVTAERRSETITPLQKLFVLNGPFVAAAAGALADRLTTDVTDPTSDGDKDRIDRAYRLLFGRPPTDAETTAGLDFLAAGDDPAARWKQYAHALLASNEMLYLD
jgi:hypothetical protein